MFFYKDHQNEVIDFIYFLFSDTPLSGLLEPIVTDGCINENNSIQAINTIASYEKMMWSNFPEDVMSKYITQTNTNPYDAILHFVSKYFQMSTETGISSSLYFNSAYYPYSLKSPLYLNKPVFVPSGAVILDKLADQKEEELIKFEDYIYHYNLVKVVQFPILFDYVLSRANKPEDIFKVALDIRDDKSTRGYRKWCRELDECLIQGKQFESVKMIDEVEKFLNNMTKHIPLGPPKVQIQISFPPAVIFEIPDINITRKDHLLFLEKIYRGSLNPLVHNDKLSKLFKIEI